MPQWLHVALALLIERFEARRDAKIRFLKAEVQILRRKLSGNRVVLDPKDRCHLLRLGGEIGHHVKDIIGIVSYKTYQRWLREQMQGKTPGKVGRPGIGKDLRELIIRIAKDNAQWGYRRIVGELRKLALSVSSSTVSRMLKDEGIYPEPSKGQSRTGDGSWRRFIRLHMDTLVACDFFTKKIATPFGFRTAYFLFFIHLGSRKVCLSPPTYHANETWVLLQACSFNKWCQQQDIDVKYLIRDRDRKYAHRFDEFFSDQGAEVIRTPVQAPNANAFAESWVATVKRECLNYFVCFSLGHLDHIAHEFLRFYNRDRPHQGIGNRPLDRHRQMPSDTELMKPMCCREYLGGLLRVYGRAA
jgi:putative transposase